MGARALFLVGFMGSGKTSVGRELARRAGWDFVDLDENIRLREGKQIPEIFRERGEPAFRAAETAALMELLESLDRDSVVALGGGAFATDKNRTLLESWPSVFLQTPVDELWQRCSEDKEIRPLQKDYEQFAQLHADRLPFYQQATITVETSGKDPAVICTEIEVALQRMNGWMESVRASSGSNRSSETGGSK